MPHGRSVALLSAATLLLPIVPTGCAGLAGASSGPSAVSEAEIATALARFRVTVDRESEDGHSTITYVSSTAGAAETRLFGSAAHSSESDLEDVPVVAFVAKGEFSGIDEKVPPGEKPVGGPYLLWVARASDGVPTDWGILEHDPQLGRLGPLTRVG